MAKGKITKRALDEWIAQKHEGFVWDESIKGFGARFSRSGAVSYVLQYRMGGRETSTRRYTIGNHGSPWTPATAREEAVRISLMIAQGIDPVEADNQRRRIAIDLAFENYANQFIASCRRAGWRGLVERSIRIYVKPVLGKKPLPNIKRHDIISVLDHMPAQQAANRRNVYAVLRRLFAWAVSRGDIERSPMEGMEAPPPGKARDRWLSDPELVRVWQQSFHTNRHFGAIVRLLILTGQRREEVASLSWEELDREERMWSLPGGRSKNGEPNNVSLGTFAISVLDEVARSDTWPRRGRVFSTSSGAKFSAFSKGKAKLDELVAEDGCGYLAPWRLHDLRRTLATGFQRLGVRFEVTEAVLNHLGGSRAGVAGVYQRYNWKQEKIAALDGWNDHIAMLLADPTDQAPDTA